VTTGRAETRTEARQQLWGRMRVKQEVASSSIRRGAIAQQQAHMLSGNCGVGRRMFVDDDNNKGWGKNTGETATAG
jgi:hypothetical protein